MRHFELGKVNLQGLSFFSFPNDEKTKAIAFEALQIDPSLMVTNCNSVVGGLEAPGICGPVDGLRKATKYITGLSATAYDSYLWAINSGIDEEIVNPAIPEKENSEVWA